MPGSLLEKCYGAQHISERHRHRYEFNNEYRETLTAAGLVLSGLSPDGRLVEVVERHDHPFYIGVQYHPEFKSRPNRPHPLFRGFVAAALELSSRADKARPHGKKLLTLTGGKWYYKVSVYCLLSLILERTLLWENISAPTVSAARPARY